MQVSKRQVSKCLVSKRPVSKRQVYKTSGLQNVRFQNVWFQNVWFQNSIEIKATIQPVFKFYIVIKQKVQELPSLHSYLKQRVCHFYLLLAIMMIDGKTTL